MAPGFREGKTDDMSPAGLAGWFESDDVTNSRLMLMVQGLLQVRDLWRCSISAFSNQILMLLPGSHHLAQACVLCLECFN